MSEIGKAYIQIIPSATGIGDSIEKELGASGEKGGNSFKKGLMSTVGGTGVKVFAATAAAAGAVGGAAVKAAGDVAAYGDNIDKMSQKLGLSKEGFQKWDYVLSQSGADINSMQTGLKTLTNKLDDAKNGSAQAIDMFAQLGISEEQLATMSREDVFEATIFGFQGMADSTERAALANDLFGKSGQNLTPLFNESVDSTKQLMKAAEDLGMVMSDEAVQASVDFADALDTMQRTAGGLKNNLVADFLPGITDVMGGLTEMITGGDGFSQISEGFSSLFTGITDVLPQAMEMATTIISALADAFISNLPMFVETGMQVITQLLQGIGQALPQAITSITQAFIGIVQALTNPDTLTGLLEAGLGIVQGLAQGILEALPMLIEAIPTIIQNIMEYFKTGFPIMLEALMEIITMIAEQLPTIITAILEMLPTLITMVVDTLIQLIPVLVQGGIQLFMGLVQAIPQAIPPIVEALPQIITSIIDGLTTLLPQLVEAGIELFVALVENLPEAIVQIVEQLPKIIAAIVKGLMDSLPKIIDCGKKLIEGLGKGIVKGGAAALKAVASVGKAVVDKAKSLLGIHSPSIVFEEMGKLVDEGFVIGIESDMTSVKGAMNDIKDTAEIRNDFDYGSLKQDIMVQDVGETSASAGANNGRQQNTVIMQIDKNQFGKVVYEAYNTEKQRMGVRLDNARV